MEGDADGSMSIYSLNATGPESGADQAEFFCSVPSSSAAGHGDDSAIASGELCAGGAARTGVEEPQQLSLILQNDPAGSAQWKLAGLFIRPLTAAGHDGVWYWTQARALAEKKQNWNAYFYYQTAEFLLNPVDFLSSPNLEKLQKETQEVSPAELPGQDPLILKAAGRTLKSRGCGRKAFRAGWIWWWTIKRRTYPAR